MKHKISIFWRSAKYSLAAWVLVFVAYGGAAASDGDKLTGDFRHQFTNLNSVLTEINVLESKPLSSKDRAARVYVVHAIRPDHRFEGNFGDEQFGVFLVDENQKRIVKVLEIFHTPRWFDYDLKIKHASFSKVIVTGRGATYRDSPIVKTYNLVRNR